MQARSATPMFRMFDIDKAREFYIDYLGFSTVFEHRFDENAPLYIGLNLDGVSLHLSEHHGDATPGSAVRIEIDDLKEFHARLEAKSYRFAGPGIEHQTWGVMEIIIKDPFGNRLVFFQEL